MNTTVRTVAHWAKKSWMRCENDGPLATGTSSAWCSCWERAVSASMIWVLVCTAPEVTGEVSADLGATSPLHPQDLFQSRTADLELLGRGLARAQHALELVARNPQGFGGPGTRGTLAPREDLAGQSDRPQRQWGAMDGAWTLHQLLEQCRSRDVGGEQGRHQVRAAAVMLLRGVGRVLVAVLVGGDRLVLHAVVGRQV